MLLEKNYHIFIMIAYFCSITYICSQSMKVIDHV